MSPAEANNYGADAGRQITPRLDAAGTVDDVSTTDSEDDGGYQPLWVKLACILVDFLTQMYDQVRIVPEIALFERSICLSYYSAHDPSVIGPGQLVPEFLCKIPPVQQKLAHLRGWKAFYDGLAVLLTAIPMGILADRFGRKKIIASSIAGPIAATSWILLVGLGGLGGGKITNIWWSSLFFLFGNLSSANATLYAVAADSCPPSKRSQYFYYLYSTFLVCELVAPALASVTINKQLLIPFGVGLGCLVLCFPILAIMPETHKRHKKPLPKSRADGQTDDHDPEAAPLISRTPGATSNSPSFLSILKQRNLIIAFIVSFVGAFRIATVSVLLQYTAARFGWPISRTAILVSAIAAMNIVLFLGLLPQVIAYLTTKRHIPPQLIDYQVVRASLCILALGALLMGLAPSMYMLVPAVLLFASGYGTRVAVLSIVSSWTTDNVRARVFSIAQLLENTGRMASDPMLLRIFAASIPLGGFWQGLPFFVAASCFGAGALAWRFVRVEPRSQQRG
ncbi:major facilitator superfamily domain-containing protein [Pseudomassariella vexata]|uniref:Major facilitator superfamily domain-containing protein n=1 Tax=Pseudomassariella vexata TaxID=1141098 RepID=A0A1Y2DBF7_9PEZI|nr:major facilitator superfamily domain-containing protein [Pseudomassariella vexata]ORY56601.1 major facilitator superfamily domain-containing protein [Pseudomassariella vexata]